MDIDTMTAEKQTSLMKQGLCFKCEGRGHLAKDCKGKKKDNSSPKKNINNIHAMLIQLTEDEKKGLLGMQQTEMKKEEDFETEDCLDVSLSYPIYCPVFISSSR